MLTIENIDKIKVGSFKVGEDKWQIKMIQIASDCYQFVLQCIEAHPAAGVCREAIFTLYRKPIATAVDYSSNTYSMINLISGRSVLVSTKELKAPGLFCGPILKLLEAC